jgi:hypothetical protein
MSQQAVERTLGKLLTDEAFRERFFAAPELASWEVGLQLSAVELEALSGTSRPGLLHLAAQLDKRICRVPLARGDPPAAGRPRTGLFYRCRFLLVLKAPRPERGGAGDIRGHTVPLANQYPR